ncbi:hypothetical protein LIER_02142 [Lithospermum erythrorhizon]|uniref:DUF4283 domain-containing protein n=1 Tax=Lithospermum erythrorhizon TaxID=34254 RepID=A0AAV3NNE2_LITER
MKLTFITLEVVNGKQVVKYQSIDVMPDINRWKLATYGFVMGINPSVGAVESFAQKRFKRFVLKSWTPESKLERNGVEKIPVWIRIPFLSIQFWNEEMFSKIGSYIGVPLFADEATSELTRVSYARLYVKVAASRELPKEVPLVDENGVEFMQRIEYEWIPPCYNHCVLFGHEVKYCRFGGKLEAVGNEVTKGQKRREWRPRVNNVVVEEPVVVENDSIVDSITHQVALGKEVVVPVNNTSAVLDEEKV